MLHHSSSNRRISRRSLLGAALATTAVHATSAQPPAVLPDTQKTVQPTRSGLEPVQYIDAGAYGLNADGETDDAPALQQAIDDAAAAWVPLLIRPGRYAVHTGLEARDGTTIDAFGVTLVTYIPGLGDPGTWVPTMIVDHVRDVTIVGLSVDGRKDAFAHSQWKHGFGINDSSNVVLDLCVAYDCKGDGIGLAAIHIGDVSTDIRVSNSQFLNNYRNGGYASAVIGATFTNCVFRFSDGTAPMMGFDVEPDRADVICEDVSFIDCDFSDNGALESIGGGFNVSYYPDATAPQRGVYVENCTMYRNAGMGIVLYRRPQDVEIRNCHVGENGRNGVSIHDESSDITIADSVIEFNARHGIEAIRDPVISATNIQVLDTRIQYNSRSEPGEYDGVHLVNDIEDVTISGCVISGSHRYGIYAEETVQQLQVEANDLGGNTEGPASPASIAE